MPVLAFLLAAVLILVLDQCSKALVRRQSARAQTVRSRSPLIRFRVNRRAFTGPLSNSPFLVLLLATVIAGLVALLLSIQFAQGCTAATALGIAAGGASSNVMDQVQHQGVVDFIDLGWWPVFNLADVAIVLGATVALACFATELATSRFSAVWPQ